MERKLRFGILGLGDIAKRFARVLGTSETGELYAVASRTLEKAEAFAAEYGAPKAYGSYEELAADPMVDAVYIATPHNFHLDGAMLAIEHNNAVLCEKPMTVTREEAEKLFAAAKEHNVLLSEAMWSHTIPTYLKAKEWIANGKIGKLRFIDAAFCFALPIEFGTRHYDPARAGGSLLDAGVYPVEFAIGIAGRAPSGVKAAQLKAPTGVDEFSTVTLDFDGEILANCVSAIGLRTINDGYLYGTEGYIYLPNFIAPKKAVLYGKGSEPIEEFEISFADGFSFQIDRFAESYWNGLKENPYIPAWETVACAEVFDEAFRQWAE